MGDQLSPGVIVGLIRREKERRLANESLLEFTRQSWHVIEPGVPFVDGWHLHAIAAHLQAVYEGHIDNLLINIPPGCMKSILVSVTFPAWVWSKNDGARFLGASYGEDLSIRDSLKCRDIITSEWYQERWPNVQIKRGEDQKTKYALDGGGWRMATSVGGRATGEHPDFKIVDDPHNVKKAESDTERQTALDWFDRTLSTRGVSRGARTVVVMQRLHEKDISGHIKEKYPEYEHLCLPMRYEKSDHVTSIGFKDPRVEDAELLWPELFDDHTVDKLQVALGSYGSAGQLQQRPSPMGGGLIKLDWFIRNRWKVAPAEGVRVVQSWDTAKKVKEINDYSVCTTWLETSNAYYLLDVYRQKLEFPDLLRAIKSKAEQWNPDAILIEDAASGSSAIQTLKQETVLPVLPIVAKEAKEIRFMAISPTVEAGRVALPESAPWLADFEAEMLSFPNGAHDDQVDSMTQFLEWVKKPMEIFVG